MKSLWKTILDGLTYKDLAAWGKAITDATKDKKIGLPAGRKRHDHGDVAGGIGGLRQCDIRKQSLRQRQRTRRPEKFASVHNAISVMLREPVSGSSEDSHFVVEDVPNLEPGPASRGGKRGLRAGDQQPQVFAPHTLRQLHAHIERPDRN